jgi:hypothetical protein
MGTIPALWRLPFDRRFAGLPDGDRLATVKELAASDPFLRGMDAANVEPLIGMLVAPHRTPVPWWREAALRARLLLGRAFHLIETAAERRRRETFVVVSAVFGLRMWQRYLDESR